jgi:hypothetical protein
MVIAQSPPKFNASVGGADEKERHRRNIEHRSGQDRQTITGKDIS